ncbi:hypothetical protein D1007_32549 [Hordeum vulgare]|nr:hypothetical protein D1007_32549 [Hordeum vulgare]
MANARRVRAERRATRVSQTTPVGAAGARRSPSPVVNATTGPEVQEQQGSSQPVTEQAEGRTATPSLGRPSGSASRARPEMPHGWRTLAMATELLRYRPAPDRHDDLLQRIEELIAAAGDSTTLDDEMIYILLAPCWISQVEGGDVISSKFPLHGDCKVYRTRRTPRLNK